MSLLKSLYHQPESQRLSRWRQIYVLLQLGKIRMCQKNVSHGKPRNMSVRFSQRFLLNVMLSVELGSQFDCRPHTIIYNRSPRPPPTPTLYCISATSSVTVVNGTCNHRLWRIRICGRCKVIGSTLLPCVFPEQTREPHPLENL